MKLYKTPDAAAGQRWHPSKAGLKAYTEVELPAGGGRTGMATWLNANEFARFKELANESR